MSDTESLLNRLEKLLHEKDDPEIASEMLGMLADWSCKFNWRNDPLDDEPRLTPTEEQRTMCRRIDAAYRTK